MLKLANPSDRARFSPGLRWVYPCACGNPNLCPCGAGITTPGDSRIVVTDVDHDRGVVTFGSK